MYDLSVILPTYNESGNISEIIYQLNKIFEKTNLTHQIVFVDDDSTDGTFSIINEYVKNNNHIYGLLRIGRRGLSSAVIEGIVAADSQNIVVMDSDLQHDPSKIIEIIKLLSEGADLVVCCRDFDDIKGLSRKRKIISKVGNWIVNITLKTKVSDPLTGFFGINKDKFQSLVRNLDPLGFKILYEIMVSDNSLKVVELKFKFNERFSGESKLSTKVFIDAIELVLKNTIGRYVSEKFIIFCLVGLVGALFHTLILYLLFCVYAYSFILSQGIATFLAIVMNYINNTYVTFRNQKPLNGFYKGLGKFIFICSIGALFNLIISKYLFDKNIYWLISGLIGALIGSVWNYSISRFIIWK